MREREEISCGLGYGAGCGVSIIYFMGDDVSSDKVLAGVFFLSLRGRERFVLRLRECQVIIIIMIFPPDWSFFFLILMGWGFL